MNKLDLIATFKNETGLTKSEATAVVDLFFNEMIAALAKGDRVEIRGQNYCLMLSVEGLRTVLN